jgi:hypothetical protein
MYRIMQTLLVVSGFARLAAHETSWAQESTLDTAAVLNTKEALLPKGVTYEATVPDTLDLAEQARLSLNGLIGNMDPDQFYGVYQGFSITKREPAHPSAITWNISVKNARTLPCIRVMNGDTFGLEAEYRLLRAMLREVREDGLMYYPFDGAGPPKGTSYPQSNASMMGVILNRQGLDGNVAWQAWLDLLAKGLVNSAVVVEDRAFYPMQAGIDQQGKWHVMNTEGEPPYGRSKRPFEYDPLKEPESDAMGYEGAARAEANRAMAFLAKHYRTTGNKDSLRVALMLQRFVMKPGMWVANLDEKRYPGYEHGIWAGHFHNGTQGLSALLDMALATNSDWMKEFCRETYENTRRNGIVRIGWFPAWSTPEKLGHRPAMLGELTEPCALADVIVDAVRLSDAGLGDYWDDVDYVVRNHLLEQQMTDLDQMRKIAGIQPGSAEDERLKRFRGGFAPCGVTKLYQASMAGCCTANGAQGYYYAWHGITRFDNGIAKVNLFLNRAASWMDIDSYLPYEGKVVLHNKTARAAMVRIPGWLDADSIQAQIMRTESPEKASTVTPPRLGNLLVFEGLKPKDKIVLDFAVPESTDQYTIHGKKYTIQFRGSTVVDINPREDDGLPDYHLYLRDKFRDGRVAPQPHV